MPKKDNADIVIISDVMIWQATTNKSTRLPSDASVGAITDENCSLTQLTVGSHLRQFYDNNIQSVRIGDSKLHSTIFFQGGLAAYKRSAHLSLNMPLTTREQRLNCAVPVRTLLIPESASHCYPVSGRLSEH